MSVVVSTVAVVVVVACWWLAVSFYTEFCVETQWGKTAYLLALWTLTCVAKGWVAAMFAVRHLLAFIG
jgi:hypothetical protein